MKLVERIMAGITACALTMCILTACGGGGGGSSGGGSSSGSGSSSSSSGSSESSSSSSSGDSSSCSPSSSSSDSSSSSSSSSSSLPSGKIEYKNSVLASYNKKFASGTGTIKYVASWSNEPGSYVTLSLITSGSAFYYEYSDSDGSSYTEVSDGENVYLIEYTYPANDSYNITEDEKIAVLEGSASDEDMSISEAFPAQSAVKAITAGKDTLNGKEYYTEEVTYTDEEGDTNTLTYYYSGSTLKYVSRVGGDEEEGTTYTLTMEIVQLSTSVDTSKLKVPDGYTIMTEEEFEEYARTR